MVCPMPFGGFGMRENAFDKSRRYLIEGRVVLTQVTPQRVDAFVRGDETVYASSYHGAPGHAPVQREPRSAAI